MTLLVLSDLWVPFPGGAERLMFNLARHLERAGENVIVATGYPTALPFDGPQTIVRLTLPEGIIKDEGEAVLRGWIQGCRPDVILTHHHWAFTFADVLRDCGVPVVQVVLNGYRLPFAAFAVYISNFVRGVLNDDRPEDMTILPPAFDDVRADTHGDAIGFIKPLHHKGVDLVYDIARAMPTRHFLILRGEWQDIETIEWLPNVEFMEPVVDMRDFYKLVRLMLMPSLSEDAGTVPQECAVNGIPCISSDVGGLPETNMGGIIMFDREVERWTSIVTRLLDDPDLYAEIARAQHELTPTAQTDVLDEFVARVRALTR